MNSLIYAAIMAGGGGTRFWPWSRERRPKQLLPILSGRSMIWETVERIRPLIAPERILVVTSRSQVEEIHREIPKVPRANLIAEPVGRNTAPCLCLAALYIERRDPGAVMAVLPADHFIGEESKFLRTLRAAADFAARKDFLVTIGVRPAEPETGYGYIQKGESLGKVQGMDVRKVQRFREKPDLAKAKNYLRRGYLWNSGIFAWRTGVFAREVQRFLPELHAGMASLKDSLGTSRERAVLKKVYAALNPVSVDYGILEKADNAAVIEAPFAWSDVGSFAALDKFWPKDKSGNVLAASGPGRKKLLAIDSSGCLVRGEEKLIALVGMKDTVVVEAGNALLVCSREKAQDVRKVLEELRARGWKKYL